MESIPQFVWWAVYIGFFLAVLAVVWNLIHEEDQTPAEESQPDQDPKSDEQAD